MALWGGRFAGKLDPAFDAFNRSLPFDWRLWREDLEGSKAWARAQEHAGSLSKREAARLVAALNRLEKRFDKDPEALREASDEDIHGFVERELVEDVGDLGKKLHAGRSRNDQVATDLRLWCKRRGRELAARIEDLMRSLAALAEREAATAMPGYTHLQRAQIVSAGHHALAYVEMIARDAQRLEHALERLDVCPLGSGALAGSFLPIDRKALAQDLGFRAPTRNSLDAVSDRDFVAELIFVATMSCAHLSRFCEDWIFFASSEAGFLELGDDVSTGSSLMPQKKNPDSLELIRGKGARALGRLTGFLACLRSLPLAYNKDLQEDKEALFECLETWDACLVVTKLAVDSAQFRPETCRHACEHGYLDATEFADGLVRRGVPFREAHEQVGQVVRLGLEQGKELRALALDDIQKIAPRADAALLAELSVERILARRKAIGAANPTLVRREAKRWKKTLGASRGS